jgi:hypothetical protein
MPTYFTDDDTNGLSLNESTYKTKIKNYRDDLDIKLKNLHNNREGAMKIQKQQIDSSVYENILLTVLGTSIIYFVFIKL